MIDRRTTLAGLMGGAVLGGAPAHAASMRAPEVLFVDSRRAAAKGFVAAASGARVIDIADAHGDFWAEIRAFTPGEARIRGLTRWSDWVLLRGALQDKGLRVRAEMPVDPASTGDAALFLWEMR